MAKGPLEGVRVLELCTYFTGPIATQILADQGAEVIKVEPPGGELMRAQGASCKGHGAMFIIVNRNKKSVCLDLKNPEHKEALLKLVATADVVIQNMKPGSMERLGLGAADLRVKFPRLIYASIAGYGQTGPNATEGAFDNMMQAICGAAYVQRNQETGKPILMGTQISDKTTALMTSQAITAALYQREKTGEGAVIEVAMIDATLWWLWPDMMANNLFLGDGVRKAVPISSVDLTCPTDDGYLVVAPHQQREWEKFLKVVNRPELLDDPQLKDGLSRTANFGYYTGKIRESFKGKTRDEWCQLLREADIPCAPVLTLEEIPNYPQVVWNKVVETAEHPVVGKYLAARSAARFNGHANGVMTPSPLAGAHTAEVLAEVGVTLK